MRSGNCRGLAVAIALGAFLIADQARADGFLRHTIPRETLALDYRTGDVMMAPPIPGGHYTKDYIGGIHNAAGLAFGSIHGLAGKLGGLCGKCGGPSCGKCGGAGLFGNRACGGCGGDGCGGCGSGLGGLFGHGGGLGGLFHKDKGGHGHGDGLGGFSCVGAGCGTHASGQAFAAPAVPTKVAAPIVHAAPQVMASAQGPAVCGGCLGIGRNGQGGGCGLCGGTGRLKGLLGHGHGGLGGMSPCGGCGGRGCGACGGRGLLGGLGHGGNGGPCGGCGGRGCGLCGHLSGLKGKVLGLPLGLYSKLTHKGEIQYFTGAGGPVPLTPGYVPYVVTTRSPRDFLAFPPFSDQIP